MKRIILFLLLLLPAELTPAADYGPYALSAPVAIDGDTLRADVHIWPDLVADVAIRVIGVDTPELRASQECERVLARRAKDYTDAWLQSHNPITIRSVRPDKYAGRFDAVVIGRDGAVLADDLIAAGHGRPYDGGTRLGWCP